MSLKNFSMHTKLFPASMVPAKPEHYHVDVLVPEAIEGPVMKPKAAKTLNLWSPWAAKADAAKAPAPPAGETKYTRDHEMDALNLWSPWAAKSKPLAPMTEREINNIKNKTWTV